MDNEMVGYDEYKKQVEEFSTSAPVDSSKTKVWIFAIRGQKWVNCGRFEDTTQATDYALSHLNQYHWELWSSQSSDLSAVQREWKRHILDRTGDLGAATSLISRKPANEQRKKEKSLYELF